MTLAKKLGELLVGAGLISAEQLAKALANQKVNKKRIGEIIVDLKMASEMDIVQTLYFELGVDSLDLSKAIVDPMAIQLVPEKLARKFSLLPISVDGKVLTVAMLDPLDFEALDDIRFATGYKVKPVATTRTELIHAIDIHYSASDSIAEILVKDLSKEKSDVEVVVEKEGSDAATLRKESETPPVIRMVNLMISDAVKSRASDLHMEPQERRLLIRNRVDGLLNNVMELPKWIQGSIVSRVKIMARMDIAEKRTPQDGRVKLRVDGKEIDLRISVLPTQYGEKVVMRLLDTKAAALPLSALGFTVEELKKISVLISKTQGVILITGPTGSGKSSTLYGIITQLKSEHLNIITLEDPIEYEIEGVSQVMIDERVGLTFANGLRSILRQDPNVVMVGEMRDRETAEIAMQASITGHMVLSTLHTNDSVASIVRLMNLGIQPYLIASSVNGVIAQRLVRIICSHCKEQYLPSTEDLLSIRIKDTETAPFKVYRGKGCDHCKNSGYSGRTGIYEVFPMSARIKEMIASKASEGEIRQTAVAEGMKTLGENALEKVRMGITTLEEIRRVVFMEGESASVCSSCGKVVNADFKVCAYCGHSIESICPICSRPRSTEWIVCPYCKTSLK